VNMPEIAPFKLERYFALYEFKAPHLLSASDCESFSLHDLLKLADDESNKMWGDLHLGYTESAGHPLLREEIAEMYQTLIPEDVLVITPEEGIFIAMQTLLNPGDEIISVFPAYQSLTEIAHSLGCRVIPWRLEAGKDGWILDSDQLERSLSAKTRMLVINFPHNPTGFSPGLGQLKLIVSLAQRHNLILFSDEMYRLLEYDPATRLPPICDLYDRGISLSGMSKSFGLPGLRIGWLGTRARDLLARWRQYKDYTTICSSAPSEILALIALRAKDLIVARNLKIIEQNLALAESFFSAQNGRPFTWYAPQGGSVAFPEWRGSTTVEQFCQDLVETQGVMAVPGSMFDYQGNHFRIGLGRKAFPRVLEQVGYFLDSQLTANA
jgi:aspartate/methionine/tyrosine aminotransferase